MSWFRRSESEVVLEAENATRRSALLRRDLDVALRDVHIRQLVAENNRLKSDACAVAALGDARARSQTRHPANRDACSPFGIPRPGVN